MDIEEILVLTLSVPAISLLLLILVRLEEWLPEDIKDGSMRRAADARCSPARWRVSRFPQAMRSISAFALKPRRLPRPGGWR